MQEAYFEKIRSKIVQLLQTASTEIAIAMAWFTSAELFSELIKSLNRGLKVQLVLLDSPINFMEYAPDFNDFIKAGGHLHIASSEFGLMHHKFCIIDDSIVITGSYNWTYYAETRNVENILITDDGKIVKQFKQEFNRLINNTDNAIEAPRYSWEVLESMDNVDFADINYETEQISKIHHKPVRKVIETKTQVFISEIKQEPQAAYNIGVLAKDKELNEVFEIIIPKNEKLPCTSKQHTLYFNSLENNQLVSHVIYGKSRSLKEALPLREEDFNEITEGLLRDKLQLHYSMTLDFNGDLRMIVSCVETGKRKIVTMLNQKLVKYE